VGLGTFVVYRGQFGLLRGIWRGIMEKTDVEDVQGQELRIVKYAPPLLTVHYKGRHYEFKFVNGRPVYQEFVKMVKSGSVATTDLFGWLKSNTEVIRPQGDKNLRDSVVPEPGSMIDAVINGVPIEDIVGVLFERPVEGNTEEEIQEAAPPGLPDAAIAKYVSGQPGNIARLINWIGKEKALFDVPQIKPAVATRVAKLLNQAFELLP